MPESVDQEKFFKALQQQLPGLKSQAQFTAFNAAFEAFRGVMNGIFEDKPELEKAARDALESAFKAAKQVTELTARLTEDPEAATSKAAEEFKQPPAEFGEYDEQRKLMSELAGIQTHRDLMDWYKTNKPRLDRVKSPSLRNPLIDAIRERKVAHEKAEA
jgi:hypothetical protein